MIFLLPFFGKYLENAVFVAWKAKSIIKAKEKRSCLKPNDICFFIFCHFGRLDPHFPSSLKACPSLSVLSLGLPPPVSSPLTMICNPPTFHLLRLPPALSFMSSQKACSSLYHLLIRLCFYKIVRRNIHFSVISHSLCNRTVNYSQL